MTQDKYGTPEFWFKRILLRWMNKEHVVYMYTVEYYSVIKKNEILPFLAIWMDLEDIILIEISQRKTNNVWYHLYGKSKKNTGLPWWLSG